MKICLYPYEEGSGVGTYILELAKDLAENTKHEIIAIGNKKLKDNKIQIYQSPKKRSFIYEIPPFSWFYAPYIDNKISKLVNKIKPNQFIASDFLVINKIKCPTSQIGWDYPKGIIGCIKLSSKYEKFWKLPYRIIREIEINIKAYLAFKQVKQIFSVTQYVNQKIGPKGIFIPPGINISKNKEKKFNKSTITFVGRNHIWTKRKGLKYLFNALTLIEKHKQIDYNLVLIGKVPNNFNQILNKYEKIKHHIQVKGLLPREETLKIIKKSHLLAAPSLYDEFGFAVLEALSYGTPVIASKHNHSFQEMIGNNYAGLNVDIFNKKEFAQQLYRLLTNKKQLNQLSKNAVKQVKENYSWEIIIPKMLKYTQP